MNTVAPQSQFYTVADISRATGVKRKTVQRIAEREAWPANFDGYRWTFAPPAKVADAIVARPVSDEAAPEVPAVKFADLTHSDGAREKVLLREQAVLKFRGYKHFGIEVALCTTVAEAKLLWPALKLNNTNSLRQWDRAYTANGIDGLVEQKRGRVGRKAFVDDLEESQILQLAADAVGGGNWKRNAATKRINVARGFRNLAANPTVEGPARAWLHGGRASKSSVPPSVRAAIQERCSPLAATLIQVGSKAAKLDGAFTECSYDNVQAGDAFTADDMTANCYVWAEWPNEQGFILIRPQILAAMDIGSMSWLTLRAVIRSKGQYTKDDVWGMIGDIFDDFGLFKTAVLEGGIWQSNVVKGNKTGIDDATRFGGLQSLGVKLIHTRTPRGKIIETAFNVLQHAADNVRGFCGRDERKDCPEETKRNLALVRGGHAHARQFFLHIDEYAKHLAGVMRQLNNERGDGKILRGLCPADKWAEDIAGNERTFIPDSAKWMYRAAYRVCEITRNGVRITVGSGKYQTSYTYAAPELEVHRGRRCIVFWNDYDPDTDAVVYTLKSGKPDQMICVAPRVQEIPRFGANADQMAGESTRKKLAMNVARSQKESLAPYLARNHRTAGMRSTASQIDEKLKAVQKEQGRRIHSRKTLRDFRGGAEELLNGDGVEAIPTTVGTRSTASQIESFEISPAEDCRTDLLETGGRGSSEGDPLSSPEIESNETDLSANALLD